MITSTDCPQKQIRYVSAYTVQLMAVLLLVFISVLSGTAFADKGGKADKADKEDKKIILCHIPPGQPENAHTVTISVNAENTHVDHHDDYPGECIGDEDEGTPTPTPTPAGTATDSASSTASVSFRICDDRPSGTGAQVTVNTTGGIVTIKITCE